MSGKYSGSVRDPVLSSFLDKESAICISSSTCRKPSKGDGQCRQGFGVFQGARFKHSADLGLGILFRRQYIIIVSRKAIRMQPGGQEDMHVLGRVPGRLKETADRGQSIGAQADFLAQFAIRAGRWIFL
jgi:hypothetical protein